MKIEVLDYDPVWTKEFQKIRKVLLNNLSSPVKAIEHIGSTSVADLAAKPILDIDIIIEADSEVQRQVIEDLAKLGYEHLGDLGITGREAFRRFNERVPYTASGRQWMKHNLYLCRVGSTGLRNHLLFRDYLRKASPEKEKYSRLKKQLAVKYPHDIDAYIDGKTDFIMEILKKAGLDLKTANLIAAENKLNKSDREARIWV